MSLLDSPKEKEESTKRKTGSQIFYSLATAILWTSFIGGYYFITKRLDSLEAKYTALQAEERTRDGNLKDLRNKTNRLQSQYTQFAANIETISSGLSNIEKKLKLYIPVIEELARTEEHQSAKEAYQYCSTLYNTGRKDPKGKTREERWEYTPGNVGSWHAGMLCFDKLQKKDTVNAEKKLKRKARVSKEILEARINRVLK